MRSTITVPAVVAGLGGMLLVGLCAASGSVDVDAIVPGTFVTVASLLGAVLLTTPALVALQQFLGLSAKPEATIGALAQAIVVGGRVAAGLAPACLFFAATTRMWPALLALGLAVPGLATAIVAVVALRRAEGLASSRFTMLLVGWTVLTTLIALRIAFDLVELSLRGGLA